MREPTSELSGLQKRILRFFRVGAWIMMAIFLVLFWKYFLANAALEQTVAYLLGAFGWGIAIAMLSERREGN